MRRYCQLAGDGCILCRHAYSLFSVIVFATCSNFLINLACPHIASVVRLCLSDDDDDDDDDDDL